MSWYAIWKYLRTAPTLPSVRSRLNELLAKFPNSKKYVDFLWRNVSTWALCAFTWELEYGFQASSMQEGVILLSRIYKSIGIATIVLKNITVLDSIYHYMPHIYIQLVLDALAIFT
jgi:hypothetical protein